MLLPPEPTQEPIEAAATRGRDLLETWGRIDGAERSHQASMEAMATYLVQLSKVVNPLSSRFFLIIITALYAAFQLGRAMAEAEAALPAVEASNGD